MSNKSHPLFYTIHLITVKAVKLISASIWWRIYFCNDIMYWNPATFLKTRSRELGSRTIWLKEFNVLIIIFYWNVVCNIKVPIITRRTSINDPGMMSSIDKTIYFCWISKLLEAPPNIQFRTMFSAAGINSWFLQVPLKMLKFENLDTLKTIDLGVHKPNES